jgi:hypothetical protein
VKRNEDGTTGPEHVTDEGVELRVVRLPSMFGIAMGVVPLVRRGVITEAEGQWLAEYRYGVAVRECRRRDVA